MKKFLSLALVIFCLLSLAGCVKGVADRDDSTDISDSSDVKDGYSNDSADEDSDSSFASSMETVTETEVFAEKFYSD